MKNIMEREEKGNDWLEKLVILTSPITIPALIMAVPILSERFSPGTISNMEFYGCFLPQAIVAGAASYMVSCLYVNGEL